MTGNSPYDSDTDRIVTLLCMITAISTAVFCACVGCVQVRKYIICRRPIVQSAAAEHTEVSEEAAAVCVPYSNPNYSRRVEVAAESR
jgi:hypothetical protein